MYMAFQLHLENMAQKKLYHWQEWFKDDGASSL